MANTRFRLTPYGHDKILKEGIYSTFINYALEDELQMYNVGAGNDLIDSIGRKTGSHRPYTDDASCLKANVTPINVDTPIDDQLDREGRRAVINIEYSDCANPYTKQNLTANIDLAEYFDYLYNLPTVDYVKTVPVSLTIYDTVSYDLQQRKADGTWENIDSSEQFVPTLRALPKTVENLKKLTSRFNIVDESGAVVYFDKALERFWNPLLFNLLPKSVAGSFIEAQKLVLTPYPGTFGAVVNGNLNFMNFEDLGPTDSYDTIKPAAKINNNTDGIYWMSDNTKTYKVDDENKFAGQMVYNFINKDKKYLIQGLVELMRNSVEFKFTETSFGIYELKLEFEYVLDSRVQTSVANTVGGRLTLNFIYDTNKATTGLWDNVIEIVD